jgi:hypothetical protein
MWWIWIALLIEAVGLLLVWGLLLTAAPRSEKEQRYEDEAQAQALDDWRASGCCGWVAIEPPKQESSVSRPLGPPPDIGGQLVDPPRSQGRICAKLAVIGSPLRALIRPTG